MRPFLVTPPANPSLDLAVLKEHVSVDGSHHDDLLTGYVAAASKHFEAVTSRAFITQTWGISFDGFEDAMILPIGNFQSVDEIKYFDENNDEQTLASNQFYASKTTKGGCVEPIVKPKTYDREDAVTIKFIVGYGADESSIPEDIKQALMMTVADWYENRGHISHSGGAVVNISTGAYALIEPYKLDWIM